MWVTFGHAELLFIESIEVVSFRDCYRSQVCDIQGDATKFCKILKGRVVLWPAGL